MTTMTTEIEVCRASEIPAGEGRNYRVGEETIAVFHTRGGGVYAVQANCPHRGGPLSDGLVGGTTLICPLHSWKFDLTTGEALSGECGLRTYPVHVNDAGIVILTLGKK